MKAVYKILAIVVAAQVVLQSMAMVYAVAGQGKWVLEGGVLDAAVIESRAFVFPEVLGYAVHGMVGTMIIPLTALILLISSFFTKVPGAVKWAALVLLLVAAQVTLGFLGHDIPVLGALHGFNALLLFSAAIYAARLARNGVASQTADPDARLAPRT